MLTLAFNPIQQEFLATGDAMGQVRIWRLSHALSTVSKHEAPVLSAKKPETKNKMWLKYTGLVL